MYAGKLVFSQVMDHLPLHAFRRCVSCYQGERYVKQFRCLDQFFVMAFAQLSHHESLPAQTVADLYTILQIMSLTLFEKTSLIQLLGNVEHIIEEGGMPNQLDLFGY